MRTLVDANFVRCMEMIGLADITTHRDEAFVLDVGPPWSLTVDGAQRDVCVRAEEPPHTGELNRVRVHGEASIRIAEIPLRHLRLGDVGYSFGQGRIGAAGALLVASKRG